MSDTHQWESIDRRVIDTVDQRCLATCCGSEETGHALASYIVALHNSTLAKEEAL